ncbi:hypothetical protein [Luteirhabdus pelagi]|uniref:hypothetical protein n=1 Tax=Luteirhabdus pelagi TaxID=2792783 RepID=UPI00193A5689|nr:hypothetical protein [Luteirhabdus pelagi]
MKKISLLILIAFLTFSCSSSDDNDDGQSQTDPIIAKWQFGKVIYTYDDGTQNTNEPTACDLQSSYTFLADNTIELISLIPDNNGGCEVESVNFEYFNWSKIEDGIYRITVKNVGEPEEVDIENVTFESNKMIWTEEFDNPQTNVTKIENYFTRQN